MGHPKVLLPFLLLFIVTVSSVKVPSAIPFPQKEDLDYLTSDEEERLIYGGDESVIMSKIKDLPDATMHAPNSKNLPMPTMDPPLPEPEAKRRPPKSNRGFPFRIPRVFLKQGARMITPLNRKPRTRMGIPAGEMPVPTFRSRPSTLISSDPDQLEVAFKRIEIMASRAGLNMSAMPRRTQIQVLKRLIPKLPPKLSYLVKNEMKDHSTNMFQYLPEPMRDPLIEDTQAYLSSFLETDEHDHLLDEFSDFSVQQPAVKRPEFDASKISITNEDIAESHEQFGHLPSITTEKYGQGDRGNPSYDLIPPSELHDDLHDFDSHKYDVGASTHNLDRGTLYARGAKQISSADSLVSASESLPSIITSGSFGAVNRSNIKISSGKDATTRPPVRVALPTKDRFVQIPQKVTKFHNFTEPIRVSIISKDRISINRSSDPFVKVIQIEEVKPTNDEVAEETAAIVEEIKPEPNPIAENEAHKQLTRLKIISKDVIQAEEDKYKLSQEKSRSRTSTTAASTTTTTVRTTTTGNPATLSPDILLKLDNYDDTDWADSMNYDDEAWADQYDLTDEEIAATVAELKKYEEQSSSDNSLEQEYPFRLTPHPLEYPDHPDHPKDSPEEPKKDKKPENTGPPSSPVKRPFPDHTRRPGGGPFPRRPPMMRRPPFKRPPHHRRPMPPGPPRPMGPKPLRINDVTVSEIPKEFSKECDYFSDELCLVVQDYPIEAISEAIEQHPDIGSVLVREPEIDRSWVDGVPRTQEHNYNFKHYFGQRKSEDETTTHRHRDFAGEGGFLCPSKVAYGQVKKGKSSSTGDWKYIVNYGENTQTLRLEKCLSPGNTCSYVMPHYRTACTQVHNYHRLLAWEPEKGLHMDVFKIPTCCTCHVQGYYIPQQSQALGFSQARRRDLPPKLKFAPPPPRPPFPRGAKKIPSLLTPVPNGHSNPSVVVTDVSTKPNDRIKEHAISSSAKELKDDLQDLLAQYSALRERIAKKKNENIHVSYTATISNSSDSLRPQKRGLRNPTKLKPLLQLKKLQLMNMKKMNLTTKDGKAKKPFARARAMLIARLNRKLKSSRSGRAMRQELNRLDGNRNGRPPGVNLNKGSNEGGILSMESLKNRIQMLRSRLNKYNERNKSKPHLTQRQRTSIEERLQDNNIKSRITNNNENSVNNNNNNSNNRATSQRLRLNSNRPSKVNYSYHPIMDYFNSKTRLSRNS